MSKYSSEFDILFKCNNRQECGGFMIKDMDANIFSNELL